MLGAVGALLSNAKKSSLRSPAATAVWQGKHHRLFEVSVSSRQGLPETDEQDLILKGTIQGLQPIEGEVYYKWILPPGASLVSGDLEDSVVGLPDPRKFLETKITIHGVSRESEEARLVILQVYTKVNGVRIGSTAVFSNRPDEVDGIQNFQAKESARALPAHIHQ